MSPFKKCGEIRAKMVQSDERLSNILCLGEGHKTASCLAPRARDDRAACLKAAFWEKAIKPLAAESQVQMGGGPFLIHRRELLVRSSPVPPDKDQVDLWYDPTFLQLYFVHFPRRCGQHSSQKEGLSTTLFPGRKQLKLLCSELLMI